MSFDRKHFYSEIKAPLHPLYDTLLKQNVTGFEDILAAWEKSGKTDSRQLAYMLATAYHETARTMQPIREKGDKAYFIRRYWDNIKVRKALGNRSPDDAHNMCGNGLVQITGYLNYLKFEKILGIPLTTQPELARVPENAIKIMFIGMEKGVFTGKKLDDYINIKNCDLLNARRIINGTDCASDIEKHARKFMSALVKI